MTVIKTARMKPFQIASILTCMVIVTIDGLDVFVMGFVLPHLPADFFESTVQKGFLLSAGLAGMAVGAIVLAPLADIVGRQKVVVLSLVGCTAGMFLSAIATNAYELIIFRAVTGVAIGSMAASLMILVQEYTSEKARNVVFGVYSLGFPVGSALGGFVGVSLVNASGGAWQAMFVLGGSLSLFGLVLAIVVLPESIDFLVARPSPRNHARIERIAAKLGNPTIRMPDAESVSIPENRQGAVSGLFRDGMWRNTLLLWIIYAGLMTAFYFANTWTPQLVTDATGSTDAGTTAGLILSGGSFIGAIMFALLSLKVSVNRLVSTAMCLAGISMLVLAAFFHDESFALAMTWLVGIFTYLAITAMAALIVPIYSASSRATAGGWMVGVGRLFSIGAPIAAGYLLVVVTPDSLYAASAVPLLVGGACALMLTREMKRARQAGLEPSTLPGPEPAEGWPHLDVFPGKDTRERSN